MDIVTFVLGALVIAVALRTRLAGRYIRRRPAIDLGTVSEQWLAAQRGLRHDASS